MPVGRGQLKTYNMQFTTSLQLQSCVTYEIYLEDKPFASGGCREAFCAHLRQADGSWGNKLVAKRYLRSEAFLEDYVCAQMARECAEAFNKKLNQNIIQYLVPNQILTMNGQNYGIETFLQGTWQKHNNIFGMILSNKRTPDAFSHFSFVHSSHQFIILDVQGVEDTLTDPAVVSLTQGRFGYTDTGAKGIREYFKNHVCNDVCKSLGLVAIRGEDILPDSVPRPRWSSSSSNNNSIISTSSTQLNSSINLSTGSANSTLISSAPSTIVHTYGTSALNNSYSSHHGDSSVLTRRASGSNIEPDLLHINRHISMDTSGTRLTNGTYTTSESLERARTEPNITYTTRTTTLAPRVVYSTSTSNHNTSLRTVDSTNNNDTNKVRHRSHSQTLYPPTYPTESTSTWRSTNTSTPSSLNTSTDSYSQLTSRSIESARSTSNSRSSTPTHFSYYDRSRSLTSFSHTNGGSSYRSSSTDQHISRPPLSTDYGIHSNNETKTTYNSSNTPISYTTTTTTNTPNTAIALMYQSNNNVSSSLLSERENERDHAEMNDSDDDSPNESGSTRRGLESKSKIKELVTIPAPLPVENYMDSRTKLLWSNHLCHLQKTMFLKYGTKGSPHRRLLFVYPHYDGSQYKLHLAWHDITSATLHGECPLEQLQAVHLNASAKKFQRHLKDSDKIEGRKGQLYDRRRCFTLEFNTRNIDLVAINQHEWEIWTTAMQYCASDNKSTQIIKSNIQIVDF